MLVLTRRVGESIVIGNGVVVKIVEIRGDQIRVGITAPPEVIVHRQEVYEQIQAENREAAQTPRALQTVVQLGQLLRTPKP
jgi:carbon storage regulator